MSEAPLASVESFFALSLDLMCIAGTDGYFRLLNPAWERKFGWTAEEMMAVPWHEFVHPEDRGRVLSEMENHVEGSITFSFESRQLCRDGSYRLLLWNAVPDLDVGLIYAMARDLTEQRAAEDALRASEAESSAVLETAVDAIITIDAEGTIEHFNPAAVEMFGYAAEEVIGDNVNVLMPEPFHSEHDGYLARYLETGEKRVIGTGRQVEGRRRDGTVFPMGLTVGEVDREHRSFTGIARDLSDLVTAQVALEDAMLQAERANRAKSEFLSGMSHEVRTPLNAMLGFAQLVEMEATTDEERESADQILRAGRHLLDLIDEVLDISRIESGRMRFSLEPVSVDEVVGECLDLVGPQAGRRSVEVVPPDAEGLFVRADRQRLKQVVLNLLSNAVKFNRDGGSVTLEVATADPRQVRISVADTGPGISAEMTERLFEPFDRLGVEASVVEGTGLGLTLAKRLVETMGGTIDFETAPGEGSTFWIEMPAATESSADDLRAAKDVGVARTSTSTAGCVLYVEDNQSNIRLVERLLEARPEVELLTATHGVTGVEMAAQRDPDLILLDLHLPDIPGQEVLARVRAQPETSEIPVVVLSADATPVSMDELLDAGADDYLTKPLEVPRFFALLDDLLGRPAG